jgi:hypothetical protein
MTRKEVGVATLSDEELLSPNWHRQLNKTQLAAYVRYQYVRYSTGVVDWEDAEHTRRRSSWDGGTSAYGVKHSNVWTQVVDEIRRRNADPGMWVAAHFMPGADFKDIAGAHSVAEVRPRSLISSRSPALYENYCKILPDVLESEFFIARNNVALRYRAVSSLPISDADRDLMVICDEEYVNASPFLRHAFAAKANCLEGIERFVWLAALDYDARQRHYDAAIKNNLIESWVVTDCLRYATQEIRRHWYTERGDDN